LTGIGHGFAMMGNAITFHQIDSLDSYVDGLIEDNGGAYGVANVFAHVGVGAGALAGGIYAAGAFAAWETAISIPTFGPLLIPSAGGTAAVGWGISGSTLITVTGAEILTATGLFGTLIFLSRSDAIKRVEGLAEKINEHLNFIRDEPGARAVNHWKGEIRGWIGQIDDVLRHMGKKTGKEWAENIGRWLEQLGE